MGNSEFVAIDVETANADMASICQIGLARYVDGELVGEWAALVDPEDEFDGWNVRIHGIDEHAVRGAPRFPDLHGDLNEWCAGQIVVCHTHFDRTSVYRASTRYGLPPWDCRWLDSARVARRAWEQFALRGFALGNLCEHFGYVYKAHDALEDAKACGFVLSRAIDEAGLSVEEWLDRVRQPITSGSSKPRRAIKGNPDGPLFGEVIVFTGALSMPRREAATLAADAGAYVPTNVNGKTTMLVVGDQDIRNLAGYDKSTKHRRAEELIRQGQDIRIMQETDFRELLELASSG